MPVCKTDILLAREAFNLCNGSPLPGLKSLMLRYKRICWCGHCALREASAGDWNIFTLYKIKNEAEPKTEPPCFTGNQTQQVTSRPVTGTFFFKLPRSCVCFILLISFSSFYLSCLEVNLPIIAILPENKRRALFQPVSDGMSIIWIRR